MVQCEMCGETTPVPKTVKIEGAELDVCASCAEFGTEVKSQQTSGTTTKYSTSSSGQSKSTERSPSPQRGSSSSRRHRDLFDEIEQLAPDYDTRIRQARESEGLSQEELADQLNEKASLIKKLERGAIQPSDNVQRKLERKLDISLTSGDDISEEEWEGGTVSGTTTLGDVVKRKD